MASRRGRPKGDSPSGEATDIQPVCATDVPQITPVDRGAAEQRDSAIHDRKHGHDSERTAATEALKLLDGLKERGMLARVRVVKLEGLELHLEPGFEHTQETEAQRAEREKAERDYLMYGAST